MIITNAVPPARHFVEAQPGTIFASSRLAVIGVTTRWLHRTGVCIFSKRKPELQLIRTKTFFFLAAAFSALATIAPYSRAQTPDPSLYSNLEWRMIGPFRAGRTVGATGVRQQPNVFYI